MIRTFDNKTNRNMSLLLSIIVSVGFLVIALFAAFKLISAISKFRKFAAAANKFPHTKPGFFFGHLFQGIKIREGHLHSASPIVLSDIAKFQYPGPNEEGLQWQREMTALFPSCFVAWLGPFFPMLFLIHPETVKSILKTSEPKALTYNLIRPWVGDGLLLANGGKWGRNRRLLTPAFHFDILKPYITIENRAADILINKIRRFDGKYFEMFNEASLYTLDVILKCAFSYDADCQNVGQDHPYVKAVTTLSKLVTNRFFKPWFHNEFIYSLTPSGRAYKKACNYVHSVAEDVIAKRQAALKMRSVEQDIARNRRCKDFLDILLTAKDENDVGLSPSEIRDEVDTFLFEGHDTTASGFAWTMYSLAQHPEHQERIYREIDNVLKAKKKRQDDHIEIDDIPKLHFLTMCVKESLRLHPPVPLVQRELTQDTIIDGHTAPKGMVVSAVIYNLHHNEEIWPNSLEFQPERFSRENCESRDPYAFVPFSAGPRNCIGQNFAMNELKVIVARLIYSFRFELDPNHVVRRCEDVILRAENGVMMKATPRLRL